MIGIREEMDRKMSKQSRVDVVILTYRPDSRFMEALKRLKRQRYPIGHIFIINTRAEFFPEEAEHMPGVPSPISGRMSLTMEELGIWDLHYPMQISLCS